MKRNLLFAVAGLALLLGLAVASRPGSGSAQERAPGPSPGTAGEAGTAADQPAVDAGMNRDIEVTSQQGPWMVSIASYAGAEAPRMARDLVTVLRAKYNLPAYVFNYGAEERRKEDERRQALLQQQREWLEKMRAQFGADANFGKVAVPRRRIEEQVAVLVGGYPDMDAAKGALDRIRNLPVEGLRGLKLDQLVYINPEGTQGEGRTISPFRMAFVVHNPAVPQERVNEAEKLDLAALRRLNADETYSLLSCRKPVTLVVAQYWLPSPLEKRGKPSSLANKVALNLGHSDVDPAAVPARNLAEWLRKDCKLESYVLHTKHASIVTVGGYDGLQDPRLREMKQRWVTAGFSRDQRYQMLNLFPEQVPMQVPH